MVEEKIEIDFKALKKVKIQYVLLALFIIFGFYLRVYHIDFPSIGYHNMKENEYISESIFFNEQGDYLHRRTFNFYGLEDGPGYFEEYAQAPLIPYMTVIFWKILGEQIWIPRLIIILFFLGSIIVLYKLMKILTNNLYLSLLSSFLLTVMPLGIYFGRNVQPESPAMFFMLVAAYFYIKWIKTLDKKEFLYSMLAVSAAGLFKLTFLIIGIPFLCLFPYGELHKRYLKNKKDFVKESLFGLSGLLPLYIIQSIFAFTIVDKSKENVEISIKTFSDIFSSTYWHNIWPGLSSYIRDNYTWWFFWFAVIGLVLILMKRKSLLSKFAAGYAISIPVYIGLLSGKIGGHAYYQMPFLPLICILSAYFFFSIGSVLKQITKKDLAIFVPLLLLLITIPEMTAANDRVWGTIFFGQDVVGEYIKQHTSPDERIFNFGHSQTQAVCTYARRRCGDFSNVTQAMELQSKFNIRFLNIDAYSWAMLQQENNKEVLNYIQNNYKIKLAGFIPSGNQLQIVDLLLEKGGKVDFTEIQQKKPSSQKVYDTKGGNVPFYTIEN